MVKFIKLFIIFFVIILIGCTKSPENVVLDFNKALIERDYWKLTELCIIEEKEGETSDETNKPFAKSQILKTFPITSKDVEIERILRVDKGYITFVGYITYVYVRCKDCTFKIALKKINHRYKVVVIKDLFHLYYLLEA